MLTDRRISSIHKPKLLCNPAKNQLCLSLHEQLVWNWVGKNCSLHNAHNVSKAWGQYLTFDSVTQNQQDSSSLCELWKWLCENYSQYYVQTILKRDKITLTLQPKHKYRNSVKNKASHWYMCIHCLCPGKLWLHVVSSWKYTCSIHVQAKDVEYLYCMYITLKSYKDIKRIWMDIISFQLYNKSRITWCSFTDSELQLQIKLHTILPTYQEVNPFFPLLWHISLSPSQFLISMVPV